MKVVEWAVVQGRGRLAVVPWEGSNDEAGGLLGSTVELDGAPFRVVGVECQPTLIPKYVRDGHVALLVDPVSNPG